MRDIWTLINLIKNGDLGSASGGGSNAEFITDTSMSHAFYNIYSYTNSGEIDDWNGFDGETSGGSGIYQFEAKSDQECAPRINIDGDLVKMFDDIWTEAWPHDDDDNPSLLDNVKKEKANSKALPSFPTALVQHLLQKKVYVQSANLPKPTVLENFALVENNNRKFIMCDITFVSPTNVGSEDIIVGVFKGILIYAKFNGRFLLFDSSVGVNSLGYIPTNR